MAEGGFKPRKIGASTWFEKICDEPYRLFFPLGILFGIVGVGHWFSFAHGWVHSYSGFYHSSIQAQAYLNCIVFGFLMTMIPRLTGSPPARPGDVLTLLILVTATVIFDSMGQWVFGELCFLAWLIRFVFFVRWRVARKTAKAGPPVPFVWIPVALLHGILGTMILMLSQMGLLEPKYLLVGKPMLEQGFIFSIVMGVGGFLGTRLMGLQKIIKPEDEESAKKFMRERKTGVFVNLLGGSCLLISFWLEGVGSMRWAYIVRSTVATCILFYNRAWPRFPRAQEFYARLIWIAMWMVVFGYWSASIFWNYRKDMLHIVFIGGYSLMIFAVGTMVVLSHGGESPKLKKRLWILWVVLIGVIGAIGHRVSSAYFPESYLSLLGSAAGFWMGVAASWLIFILRKIVWSRGREDSEDCKKEGQERVAKLRDESC